MFRDVDIRELSIDLDDSDLDDTVDSDWLDLRDDSSANVMLFQDSSFLPETSVCTQARSKTIALQWAMVRLTAVVLW